MESDIKSCTLCAARFAETATAHRPRPVVWARPGARILVAGQAPGARVHKSGKPFTDPSGDRLREWLGLDEAQFYDKAKVAILPMAFCFPGYNDRGSDLPPPVICAKTWREKAIAAFGPFETTILAGGYAMRWHLGPSAKVNDVVANWTDLPKGVFGLPHPSWRNTSWLKRNPWFETDLLPQLRQHIQQAWND